jgi:cobalt-zinc-cadmium efflux system outer membrane protein
MSARRLSLLLVLLLLPAGCLYHVEEHADQKLGEIAAHPFDLAPPDMQAPPQPITGDKPAADKPSDKTALPPLPAVDLQTTNFMTMQDKPAETPKPGKVENPPLKIPDTIPGSEAKWISKEEARHLERLYSDLEPLPEPPVPRPGPDGQPLALARLQEVAALNSPDLRQAAADVETARGNWIQARTYPNPTVGYESDLVGTGPAPGYQGIFIDQPIKTGGKLELAGAAALKDLQNAELALKRARSDLATRVRNAYFVHLVARETVRVNRGLSVLTDELYRRQVEYVARAGQGSSYEPAYLRSLAYTSRLAYKQAIESYLYTWTQLVAVINLRHLPLTEVAGRVDRFVPCYHFEEVLAHALKYHTDLLTAANAIDKARFNLKLAQVTPWTQDLDLRVVVQKDFTTAPFQVVHNINLGMPLSVWDQNKGNIIAAEGALMRAEEETHRVEVNLRNNLAAAFLNYRNNLIALQDYQQHILPDQIRALRGVEERRRIFGEFVPPPPPGAPGALFGGGPAFADLITAEQTLVTSVTTYLTLLGSLWSAVVSTADFLQTDDLFQLAEPQPIPPLPELEQLCPWPCCHPVPPHAAGPHAPPPILGFLPGAEGPELPAPAGPPPAAPVGKPRGERPQPLPRSSLDAARRDGRAEALAGLISLSASSSFQHGTPARETAAARKEGPFADRAVEEVFLGGPTDAPEPPPPPWPVSPASLRLQTVVPLPPAGPTGRPTLDVSLSPDPPAVPRPRLTLEHAPEPPAPVIGFEPGGGGK